MTITSLTPQKRRPGRVSVFVDGQFKFGMECADAAACGLAEGMEITDARLNNLLTNVVLARARDAALRYIAYRPRTIHETAKRLGEDGYPAGVIKKVLMMMVKLRYLNDKQFAQDYIAERVRAHYGLFRIRQELKMKGVRPEAVEAALALAEFDETESVCAFVRRRKMVFNRNALYRRGFSFNIIREAHQILRDEDGFNEQS